MAAAAPQLVLRLGGPVGVVLDDADGRVDGVRAGRMALEPASV
jgi:hypothetical protein